MPITMTRTEASGRVDNPGLKFDRLLPDWQEDPATRGETGSRFLSQVAACSVPDIYKQAYERWQNNLLVCNDMAYWCGKVSGRLFTGGGMPHPLETQITRNRLYGMPLLPGSGLKGLARAWARKYTELDEAAIAVLFGKSSDDNQGESGYLVFHDAWWVPGSADTPYAKEVVTVHHGDYYRTQGATEATDFDSPNPSFQLATRGSFLFVIEGAQTWADFAMSILRQGLEEEGFGGKVAAGYGYFVKDDGCQMKLNNLRTALVTDEPGEEINGGNNNMTEPEKSIWELSKALQEFPKTGPLHTERFQQFLRLVKTYIDKAKNWDEAARNKMADAIAEQFERLGWTPGGLKKDKREKQANKRRQELENLRKAE